MSRFDWLSELLARYQDEHILVRRGLARALAPAHLLELDREDWGKGAAGAARFGCRFAGLWGDPQGDLVRVHALLEYGGDYLVLRTEVRLATPVLASFTPYFAGADRLERHAQDLIGLAFLDHPDGRRWTRHQAWPEGVFPLRDDFPVAGQPLERTPPDGAYPFRAAHGSGVYEIPVGPVHAGVIEPGHFRFNAVGEEVLSLEQHLGYLHKGVEKIAVGRDAAALARLAGRVSGDSTVAHAWAACQAIERALHVEVPERALLLRAVLCERERVANHLGDIGAICNDVGFAFALAQLHRIRERWTRTSGEVFGHRFMMDRVIPGGVACDLTHQDRARLAVEHGALRVELPPIFDIIEDHPSLDDRLLATGVLRPETAASFGSGGYVGRASGQGFDARLTSPYAPYDRFPPEVPLLRDGDVAARMRVRIQELRASLQLMDRILAELPDGPVRVSLPQTGAECEGLGVVEGWRGEITTYVRLDGQGRVARFFPRDPSWFTWPALEQLIHGNIVPDFPVCNKSVNGSYSGTDL